MTGQTNAAAYTGTIKISQRIPYHTRRGRPRNLPVLLVSWKRSGRRYGIKMAFNPGMIHVTPANTIRERKIAYTGQSKTFKVMLPSATINHSGQTPGWTAVAITGVNGG